MEKIKNFINYAGMVITLTYLRIGRGKPTSVVPYDFEDGDLYHGVDCIDDYLRHVVSHEIPDGSILMFIGSDFLSRGYLPAIGEYQQLLPYEVGNFLDNVFYNEESINYRSIDIIGEPPNCEIEMHDLSFPMSTKQINISKLYDQHKNNIHPRYHSDNSSILIYMHRLLHYANRQNMNVVLDMIKNNTEYDSGIVDDRRGLVVLNAVLENMKAHSGFHLFQYKRKRGTRSIPFNMNDIKDINDYGYLAKLFDKLFRFQFEHTEFFDILTHNKIKTSSMTVSSFYEDMVIFEYLLYVKCLYRNIGFDIDMRYMGYESKVMFKVDAVKRIVPNSKYYNILVPIIKQLTLINKMGIPYHTSGISKVEKYISLEGVESLIPYAKEFSTTVSLTGGAHFPQDGEDTTAKVFDYSKFITSHPDMIAEDVRDHLTNAAKFSKLSK